MSTSFEGLTQADFEAYHPSRAGSNAYVRPRLSVKDKLLALGRSLSERAVDAAHIRLEVGASEERPSVWNNRSVTEQWVVLWRDRDARAQLDTLLETLPTRADGGLVGQPPWYHHAFLGIRLSLDHFDVAFCIHGSARVDAENLRKRFTRDEDREHLVSVLRALPADISLGASEGAGVPVQNASAEAALSALGDAEKAQSMFLVTRSCSREEALSRGAQLGDWVTESFLALLELYKRAAWQPDDDVLAVGEQLARDRAQREAQRAVLEAQEAQRLAQQHVETEKRREIALEEARERQAALERPRRSVIQAVSQAIPVAETPRAPEPSRPKEQERKQSTQPQSEPRRAPTSEPRRTAREPAPKTAREPRSQPTQVTHATTDATPKPGLRVQLKTGPFAGKVGSITDIDSHGIAKVSFGLLSTRIEVSALAVLAE